ncbi:MAG: phosphatase PAP2 family protein, partial [Bacteroidetes bacterium]|nr:phosphatase PAP2 family protein [Bacteroidota bacterium]
GHAMMTLAIFLALAVLIGRMGKRERVKKSLIATAITISLIVGFSRMNLGVHYPSDVLAGWLAGVAWASACWLIARTLGIAPPE